MKELRRIWVVPAAMLMLIGCSKDGGPLAPEPDPDTSEVVQFYLSCDADLTGGGAISCGPTEPPAGGGASGSLLADPSAVLHLESSNVSYDSGAGVLSAAVAVRNNLTQALGIGEGVAADPDGVRVFFADAPVATGGSGSITVRNPDGTGDFNATGQPYFQYSEVLGPGKSSFPKTWEWDVPAAVTSFTFVVGVSARVADGDDMSPGLNFIVTSLTADTLHTCALDVTGQPYCWGVGGSGRLGNRNILDQATPVSVATGGHKFVTVDAGLNHTCGISAVGEAWCWGNGGNGRLGTGTTSSANTPVRVVGERKYIQIEAGRSYSCGLDTEGRAFCWGFGGNGKLGNGSTNDSHLPVEVLGGHRFAWLSAGSYHTCGISTTGDAYCWGSGSNGKRGDGTTEGNATSPAMVSGGHGFTSIYAGEQHTCALTSAGEAYCWGSNSSGQLGIGIQDTSSTPVPVPTPVLGGHRFVALSMGVDYTCGIAVTGKAYCWGDNALGKLGNGSDLDGVVEVPTEVVGVEGFTSIAAGSFHTCGVTSAGQVYCWGTAENGRLGTGETSHTATPTQVTTLSGIAFLGAPPVLCGTVPGECFPRRSLRERILMALEPNGQRAAGLS